MNEYDKAYTTKDFFGDKADSLLVNHCQKIKAGGKVLDIGIGQGRNAFFLLDKGFHIDGIDPSKTAVETLKRQANEQKISLRVFNDDFNSFKTKSNTYDAILIFGLIQILSEKQIELLVDKTAKWLKSGGLVFITGFTKKEKVFMPKTIEWEKLSKSSFTNKKGQFRTFLYVDEAQKFFKGFDLIHAWEGLGKKHQHGMGEEEQHHVFELITKLK